MCICTYTLYGKQYLIKLIKENKNILNTNKSTFQQNGLNVSLPLFRLFSLSEYVYEMEKFFLEKIICYWRENSVYDRQYYVSLVNFKHRIGNRSPNSNIEELSHKQTNIDTHTHTQTLQNTICSCIIVLSLFSVSIFSPSPSPSSPSLCLSLLSFYS